MVARMRQKFIRFGSVAPAVADTPAPAANPRLAALALERAQLVDRIIRVNPSACAEFLSTFSRAELACYLDRLDALETPRGPNARWVRTGESPAIVVQSRAD